MRRRSDCDRRRNWNIRAPFAVSYQWSSLHVDLKPHGAQNEYPNLPNRVHRCTHHFYDSRLRVKRNVGNRQADA